MHSICCAPYIILCHLTREEYARLPGVSRRDGKTEAAIGKVPGSKANVTEVRAVIVRGLLRPPLAFDWRLAEGLAEACEDTPAAAVPRLIYYGRGIHP